MQVKSAIGGHWAVGTSSGMWFAQHSELEDGTGSAQVTEATLEDLYVAIGEWEADEREARDGCPPLGHLSEDCQCREGR